MSTFSYNGIQLQLIKTNLIGRDNVMSPDGTDLRHQRHTIDIDAVFNPGATAYTADSSGNPQPAALSANVLPAVTDVAIRERLMEPRRKLVFSIPGPNGPMVLLESPQGIATVDAQDGPKPLLCNVRQIQASKTFLVNFRIETYVSECAPPDQADPLVSNRFEITHQVDEQFLTTLTYSGVACFRSDALQLNSPTGNADHFRNRCLPPIPPGFQRKSIVVRVNSTGTMLLWQVTDREMMYSLGDKNPVLSFTGTYTTENCPSDAGGLASLYDHASIDLRVVGSKSALRMDLIIFALRLASERLGLKAQPVVNDDALLKKIQITEHLDDRIIDLRILAQLPPAKQGAVGLAGINAARLGVDILKTLANDNTNPQPPNDSGSRGTFTGEAFAAAIQSACSTIDPPKYRPGQSTGSPGYPVSDYNPPPPAVTVSTGALTTYSTRYSTDQTSQGVYSDYRVEARWDRKEGIMAMARASDGKSKPIVAQIHDPITRVEYAWVAERNGQKPAIPTTAHNDGRMVLLRSKVGATEKYLAPDGLTPAYRIRGQYQYVFNASGDTPLAISIPCAPWTDWKIEDDEYDEDDVEHGIIDPNQPTNQGEDDPGSPGDPTEPIGEPIEPPNDPTDPDPPSPGTTTVPGTPPTVDPPANPQGAY